MAGHTRRCLARAAPRIRGPGGCDRRRPGVAGIPKGVGCSYSLDEANLSLHDFVAMMNCFPDEGDDDAAGWPPAVADEWSAVEGQMTLGAMMCPLTSGWSPSSESR